jgi:hypothetical protein
MRDRADDWASMSLLDNMLNGFLIFYLDYLSPLFQFNFLAIKFIVIAFDFLFV